MYSTIPVFVSKQRLYAADGRDLAFLVRDAVVRRGEYCTVFPDAEAAVLPGNTPYGTVADAIPAYLRSPLGSWLKFGRIQIFHPLVMAGMFPTYYHELVERSNATGWEFSHDKPPQPHNRL